MLSLWVQIKFSVNAIRSIDSEWDEYRGPLYPSIWYHIFNIYKPNQSTHKPVNEALEA